MDRESDGVCLTIEDGDSVDEVVLAYRADGELHELASIEPPVRGTVERVDQ